MRVPSIAAAFATLLLTAPVSGAARTDASDPFISPAPSPAAVGEAPDGELRVADRRGRQGHRARNKHHAGAYRGVGRRDVRRNVHRHGRPRRDVDVHVHRHHDYWDDDDENWGAAVVGGIIAAGATAAIVGAATSDEPDRPTYYYPQ